MVVGSFAVALRLGMLPGVSEALKTTRREETRWMS